MNAPAYLTNCDSDSRSFPADWKWALFRLNGGTTKGYECPKCKCIFVGPGRDGFEQLHADHTISWSRGGTTTWDNLQLLCGPCNLKKGASAS